MITGGSDGYVYHWADTKTLKAKVKNGKGSAHSVCSTNDPKGGGEVVLVGGNDKSLSCYAIDGKAIAKTAMWTLKTDSPPRSIDVFNGNVLLGYKNGSLTVMPHTKDGKADPEVIMTSHCDGEVWGLQVVEVRKGELRAITSGDDGRILTYDIKNHKALAEGDIKVAVADDGSKKKKKKKRKGKSKPKKMGASSMSSAPASEQSRAVSYSTEL